jgi:hypothetical protein
MREVGVVMQTLKQGFFERNHIMTLAVQLEEHWRSRLASECPKVSDVNRESIIRWLMGSDLARFETLSPADLAIAKQAIEYRWRILLQRYLGMPPERAYRNLISQLGSIALLRNKIRTCVALSRDRQRTVMDVLGEVIQELLQSDNYMRQQMAWISQCTSDARLRNALLFASTEEYCLRPVRNQPLLVYRFVNYLRRSQRGGLTQVPASDMIRIVSEEILTEDSDSPVNLLDDRARAEYEEAQAIEQQQALRNTVKQEFENYLLEQLGEVAVQWLRLYLQGKTQDAIAKALSKPIKEIYRLREKISYHAVRVFALKNQPELVSNWLEISLQEHNLGLTPKQFQQFCEQLPSRQRKILQSFKAGKKLEEIAADTKLKTHQILGEWSKIYLAAQALRTEEDSQN